MVEVKKHRFVYVAMSEEIIPELFWSPMVAMVPTLEKCAQWFSPVRKQFGRCVIYKQRIVNWTVGGYFINIFHINFHTYSIFPHISNIFQQSINHLPSTFTIHISTDPRIQKTLGKSGYRESFTPGRYGFVDEFLRENERYRVFLPAGNPGNRFPSDSL